VTAPTFIDLFAGAGGWTLGFEAVGFKHLGMYDHNESACRTASRNFGADIVHSVDLLEQSTIVFPDADVVVGSPPCQGFSNEGKKDANDPRNSLVWSFLDTVERLQPAMWIFENVPGFARSYRGRWFKAVSERLHATSYQWSHFILDAADYGVPQNRKRFIIIASRVGKTSRPQTTHAAAPDLFEARQHTTLFDAISDLPSPTPGDRVGHFEYNAAPKTDYQILMRAGSSDIRNHTAQKHSTRVLEKIRAVPVGGNMAHLVGVYAENRVKYEGGYRRADWGRPSWTAYWTRGMASIHPVEDRFLTPRECARIQSFPDRHEFHGTTIENYTQVCNAVPPLMAEAVARAVKVELDRARRSARRRR